MYLLTVWKGRTRKYLARGPCVMTENQIFSRPARPHSVIKHVIIWPFLFHFHFFGGTRKHGAVRILVRPYAFFRPHIVSPRRVRPSYRNFILMVFQGNCARGRTGYMIKTYCTITCTTGRLISLCLHWYKLS